MHKDKRCPSDGQLGDAGAGVGYEGDSRCVGDDVNQMGARRRTRKRR